MTDTPEVKGPDPAQWSEAARIERGALPVPPPNRKERRALRKAEKDLRAILRDLEDRPH